MAKIYAPNKRYTGVTAGVSFIDGVGETDEKWLIQWFKNKGYEIIEEKPEINTEIGEGFILDVDQAQDLAIEEDEIRTLDNLKVDELREMAKERNIEGYSKLKKDELIAALAGE